MPTIARFHELAIWLPRPLRSQLLGQVPYPGFLTFGEGETACIARVYYS